MKNIIVFEVSQEEDGGFVAECLTEDIFTQGDTWEDLKANINEAVKGFYFYRQTFPDVELRVSARNQSKRKKKVFIVCIVPSMLSQAVKPGFIVSLDLPF